MLVTVRARSRHSGGRLYCNRVPRWSRWGGLLTHGKIYDAAAKRWPQHAALLVCTGNVAYRADDLALRKPAGNVRCSWMPIWLLRAIIWGNC